MKKGPITLNEIGIVYFKGFYTVFNTFHTFINLTFTNDHPFFSLHFINNSQNISGYLQKNTEI